MPARWKLFRTICIIQMIAAAFNELDVLLSFFRHATWSSIIGLIVFLAILFLTILGVNLVNHNYPDEPVEGKQKKNFNRLFLVNFLFLAFLFGFVIAEFRSLSQLASLSSQQLFDLPASIFLMLINYMLILVFQLGILYGLYKLRIELHANFMKREFEFEKS
jgi:ABC-type multidrug transport system permease subunit